MLCNFDQKCHDNTSVSIDILVMQQSSGCVVSDNNFKPDFWEHNV